MEGRSNEYSAQVSTPEYEIWRYVQVIRGAIMTVKATKAGEVEIVDLLDA